MIVVENDDNTVFEDETVPAQDPYAMTIEGIPQEVIDELYDEYDDVTYENYMKPMKHKKPPKVFIADYYQDGQPSRFEWFDPYTYQNKIISGTPRTRYTIMGKETGNNTLDLLSVYEYNCIKTD